jgi:RHS repeat-associated protein
MDGPGYVENLEYDTVGRLKTRKIQLEAGVTHQFDFAYNSIGELYTLTYPTTTGASRFKLKYGYSNGYLNSIRDFTGDVDNTQFWGLNVLNARGQPTDEVYKDATLWLQSAFKALTGEIDTRKFGTSATPTSIQNLAYTWDTAGNFKVRNDLRQAISETATYDALNRLTQMVGPSGAGTLTINYDAIGNVTSRSDINGGSTWTYHATKKNAVTVAGTINYAYDANGNMTSRNGVTQTWTSANLPATLATSSFSTQFSYAPDRSRWKQVATYSGATETTLFIGGLLEKHSVASLTSWKHLIATPSGEVQHVRRSDSTTETFYIPSDHLGSGDAVVDSAGTVVVQTSFNAWGARRDDDWVGAPSSTELQKIADTTRHGFTGHGMLDNVGLIHMNGRVYDPAIGRFMSADPFVTPMFGTQGLNRYSYVGNQPLSYIDPTGFQASDADGKKDDECEKHMSPNCTVIRPGDGAGGGGGRDVCPRCAQEFYIIDDGSEKTGTSHTVASRNNDKRNVTSQVAVVSTGGEGQCVFTAGMVTCGVTNEPGPFGERLWNLATALDFRTNAEIDAWGAGLIVAKSMGLEGEYLHQNPMFRDATTVFSLLFGGGGIRATTRRAPFAPMFEGHAEGKDLPESTTGRDVSYCLGQARQIP